MDDYLFAPERYVTEAFVLRSYQPGDGPLLREAIVSSYDYLRPRMLWAKKDQSEEEAEREVRTFRARYLLAEDFIMGIFSPDEAQLWGGVGFHMRHGPVSHGRAEIGMWIRASEAGRGLGTAVLRSLIDWGFTEWPWERLVWVCHASNRASARVAEKGGMLQEGRQRGHFLHDDGTREDFLLFSILKEEWAQRRLGAEPRD